MIKYSFFVEINLLNVRRLSNTICMTSILPTQQKREEVYIPHLNLTDSEKGIVFLDCFCFLPRVFHCVDVEIELKTSSNPAHNPAATLAPCFNQISTQ